MGKDILIEYLSKNKKGKFGSSVPPVIHALTQLTIGLQSGEGTIQDNPNMFIPIKGNAFIDVDESIPTEDINDLMTKVNDFISSYVNPDVRVIADFVAVTEGVVNLTFTCFNDGERVVDRFLYQIGYNESTGVYTQMSRMDD